MRFSTCKVMAVAAISLFFWLPGATADFCNELTALGIGADAPTSPARETYGEGECVEGEYRLTGKGHDFYWGWDRGAFAFFGTEGLEDFVFTARLKDIGNLFCANEKIGIAARPALDGFLPAVQLRYDGFKDNDQIVWFYRHSLGSKVSEFCDPDEEKWKSCFHEGKTGVTQKNGTYLRIERTSNVYKLYTSIDGSTWEEAAQEEELELPGFQALVGLIFSCGGGDFPIQETVTFDKISCEGPGCPATTSLDHALNRGKSGLKAWSLPNNRISVFMGEQAEKVKAKSIRMQTPDGKTIASYESWEKHGSLMEFGPVPETNSGLHFVLLEVDGGAYKIPLMLSP